VGFFFFSFFFLGVVGGLVLFFWWFFFLGGGFFFFFWGFFFFFFFGGGGCFSFLVGRLLFFCRSRISPLSTSNLPCESPFQTNRAKRSRRPSHAHEFLSAFSSETNLEKTHPPSFPISPLPLGCLGGGGFPSRPAPQKEGSIFFSREPVPPERWFSIFSLFSPRCQGHFFAGHFSLWFSCPSSFGASAPLALFLKGKQARPAP